MSPREDRLWLVAGVLVWCGAVGFFGLVLWSDASKASSPHQYLETVDRKILSSPSGYQTVSMKDGGLTGLYYDGVEEALLLRRQACESHEIEWNHPGYCAVHEILLLGLGGGEMLHRAHRVEPEARLTGVEIDQRTLELAKDEFGPWPAGTVLLRADALDWIEAVEPGSYDVVMVDLFDDSQMVPASLRVTFLAACARALRPSGLFIMNVWPQQRAEELTSLLGAWFQVNAKAFGPNIVLVGFRL